MCPFPLPQRCFRAVLTCATPDPKFDVYYARSTDLGMTWSNQELCDDPQNDCAQTHPALDYADLPSTTPFGLRDYIGIDTLGNDVLVGFHGSSDERDSNSDKSLIWATQIVFEQ